VPVQNKLGVVRTCVTAKFTWVLLSQARQTPDRLVCLSDGTLRNAARRTCPWCRRCCRCKELTIKSPAMQSRLHVHMANLHPGVFGDAAVLDPITNPSMKEC